MTQEDEDQPMSTFRPLMLGLIVFWVVVAVFACVEMQ